MKASLHKKVLEDPQIVDNIGVGSVMLLNLVRPFNTFRQNYYLNITHRSIVKVFPAHVCPPTIDLVKETPKPIIRLPMWAEKNSMWMTSSGNLYLHLTNHQRPNNQNTSSGFWITVILY